MPTTESVPTGRPRGFDADQALDRAVEVFWRQGYEGTSLGDLTEAMGIGKPSLYAAFGNKETLFAKALARYTEGPAAYAAAAFSQPTAKDVIRAFLQGAVLATTQPARPAGCLGVQGALATSGTAQQPHDLLVEWRNGARTDLARRLRRARDEGDLAEDQDPERLAAYLTTVTFGIAVQAASGMGADELHAVAEEALAGLRL
ncbi:TetR/AcrR family transcriptional regulator [Microlunatus flavus]|uniref:DNA-binding transcriptional regulator, AcrR family n=1 Tax=Microlunatus flavus TaxID=1036181 RepID=A0A1H9NAW4_9ACTN|nr:TetR/AcrR family transcriptional regulator [Microlunatus flavus]SER33094.1 DNA-binding transcriptional regulator, AcrR family [Microlunatus flavus]